jgi:hypothetical protein
VILNALAIFSLAAWLFAFLRMATSASRQTGALTAWVAFGSSFALAAAVLVS